MENIDWQYENNTDELISYLVKEANFRGVCWSEPVVDAAGAPSDLGKVYNALVGLTSQWNGRNLWIPRPSKEEAGKLAMQEKLIIELVEKINFQGRAMGEPVVEAARAIGSISADRMDKVRDALYALKTLVAARTPTIAASPASLEPAA